MTALTGTRAALTMLVLATAGYLGFVEFPPGIDMLATLPGIAALAGAAAVEEFTERDEDLSEILGWIHYGTRGLAGGAVAWAADAAPWDLPPWSLTILGVLIAGSTHHYRMKLHESLRGFGNSWLSPRTWVVNAETGGVLGLAIVTVLAPVLSLAILILMGLFGLGWFLAGRALEQRNRRDCPSCGTRIRQEASRCFSCGAVVDVERLMGAQ
jgi:hypothetical protein